MLAAATALIAQHGSRALTLAAVGEAAGYSRGIVSHHFGSRENLLRAVMRDAQTFTLPDLGDSAADWLADTTDGLSAGARLGLRLVLVSVVDDEVFSTD